MPNLLKWLFEESGGHLALIFACLAAVGAAWLLVYLRNGPGPATPVAVATGMLFQAFIQKVKG